MGETRLRWGADVKGFKGKACSEGGPAILWIICIYSRVYS